MFTFVDRIIHYYLVIVLLLSCRSGLHSRFLEFVDIYEPVLKVLLARCPQLIFAHFHFLLESTELLRRFIHIVHAQVI